MRATGDDLARGIKDSPAENEQQFGDGYIPAIKFAAAIVIAPSKGLISGGSKLRRRHR